MKQKLDDASKSVGPALRRARRKPLVETAKAKSRVLETIAGDLSKVKKKTRATSTRRRPSPRASRTVSWTSREA